MGLRLHRGLDGRRHDLDAARGPRRGRQRRVDRRGPERQPRQTTSAGWRTASPATAAATSTSTSTSRRTRARRSSCGCATPRTRAFQERGWFADDFSVTDGRRRRCGPTTSRAARTAGRPRSTRSPTRTGAGWIITSGHVRLPAVLPGRVAQLRRVRRGPARRRTTRTSSCDGEWNVNRTPYNAPGMLLWYRDGGYTFNALDANTCSTRRASARRARPCSSTRTTSRSGCRGRGGGGRPEPARQPASRVAGDGRRVRAGRPLPVPGVHPRRRDDAVRRCRATRSGSAGRSARSPTRRRWYPGLEYRPDLDPEAPLFFRDVDASVVVPSRGNEIYSTRIVDGNGRLLRDLFGEPTRRRSRARHGQPGRRAPAARTAATRARRGPLARRARRRPAAARPQPQGGRPHPSRPLTATARGRPVRPARVRRSGRGGSPSPPCAACRRAPAAGAAGRGRSSRSPSARASSRDRHARLRRDQLQRILGTGAVPARPGPRGASRRRGAARPRSARSSLVDRLDDALQVRVLLDERLELVDAALDLPAHVVLDRPVRHASLLGVSASLRSARPKCRIARLEPCSGSAAPRAAGRRSRPRSPSPPRARRQAGR